MTTALAEASSRHRSGLSRALVGVEARRCMRAPALWIGLVASAYFLQMSTRSSYAAEGYQLFTASFAGVAAGLFVLGVQVGGREHTGDDESVAAHAPVDMNARAVARLVGLWPAYALAVALSAVAIGWQHVEGGMWIADLPLGGNEATSSLVEALQPAAMFAVTLSAGLALGRACANRVVVSAIGVLVIVALGLVSWAWQWTPAVWVTLVQTQPIEVRLDGAFRPDAAPSDWMLSAPDQYAPYWSRVVVARAMAAWHVVYLSALAAVLSGLAIRGRRGRICVTIGAIVAIVGVVGGVVSTPAGLAWA